MQSFIHGVMANYSQFFSIKCFEGIFTISGATTIVLLVLLEGLLSADNALVLAMMVKHLPEKQQKKALVYGIWGAYLFRFIAIGIGTYLIKIWWVKVLGAAYLLHMAYSGLFGKGEDEVDAHKADGKGFWATVATVELMDIAFSIDSVTAAFGLSNEVWVLFLGAVFGILMMRGIAKVFVTLINKIPELEKTAFILIALIGLRMLGEVFHIEVPDILFFALLITVFAGTIFKHYVVEKKNKLSA